MNGNPSSRYCDICFKNSAKQGGRNTTNIKARAWTWERNGAGKPRRFEEHSNNADRRWDLGR
jgi:hypothetical protein